MARSLFVSVCCVLNHFIHIASVNSVTDVGTLIVCSWLSALQRNWHLEINEFIHLSRHIIYIDICTGWANSMVTVTLVLSDLFYGMKLLLDIIIEIIWKFFMTWQYDN